MTSILTFMLLGWFFWPLTAVLVLWTYCLVRGEDDDFSYWATLFMGAVIASVIYRYDHIRVWIWNAEHATWCIVAYIAVGFLIAVHKWTNHLMAFKSAGRKEVADIAKRHPDWEKGSTDFIRSLRSALSLKGDSVYYSPEKGYYLNWREFPIGNWWAYWPFFILSVVFDPIRRACRWTVNRLKKFWEGLAKYFAVN